MTDQPSRKTRRQQRLAERAAAARKARRQRRLRSFLWIIVGIVLIGAVGGWVASQALAPKPGEFVPSQGNTHIPTPDTPHPPYNSDPPTSGWHVPYLARWGEHQQPIAKEVQVHNLEHGGVAIQYNCPEGCPELVAQLRAILNRYPDGVLLAPYPGMDARIALTAWTRIDKFNEFDEARIIRFIEAYRGIDHHQPAR
jgi:hypothetical protein